MVDFSFKMKRLNFTFSNKKILPSSFNLLYKKRVVILKVPLFFGNIKYVNQEPKGNEVQKEQLIDHLN